MYKRQKIKEFIETYETCLANAEAYLEQNVNIEGSSWLHTDDWRGKSGHPLWMKNHLVPRLKRYKARKEKALQTINNKRRERLKDHRLRSQRA